MDVQATVYRDPLRRPALACGALAACAIAIAALGKPAVETRAFALAPAAASVALHFEDESDGSVVARDASAGTELARFRVGEGGFVRVTMRGLVLERKRRGISAAEPFTLTRLENGALVLRDPATKRALLLDAFGQTNAGSFAVLIDGPGAGRESGQGQKQGRQG